MPPMTAASRSSGCSRTKARMERRRSGYGMEMRGLLVGSCLARIAARESMSAAAIPYTARQPNSAPRKPLAVRASRIPISSPPRTVPTTRPRSSGADTCAANGRIRWGTMDVSPTRTLAAARNDKDGATAARLVATARRQTNRHDQAAALEHVTERNEQEHAKTRADLREHRQV